MKILNPYLIFDGNASTAFKFYKSIFGGEYSLLLKASESPSPQEGSLSPEEADKIMHICLPLPNGQSLQASDIIHSYNSGNKMDFIQGNNQIINIVADNETEARELFNKLAVEATILCPIQPMFWGDIFGQLTDQFGIQWMVNAKTDNK